MYALLASRSASAAPERAGIVVSRLYDSIARDFGVLYQWAGIGTILFAIWLAFGIQAWWEESQERAEERDALERLDAEFLEVDSVLVEWRANHAGVVDACDVLLAHTGPAGSAAALSDDSLAFLIGELRSGWTIDPPLATLSALESSGQIAALRNQDVLTQLASWRALMDDLQDDEEGLRESVDGHLNPAGSAPDSAAEPERFIVITNWFEALKERLGN